MWSFLFLPLLAIPGESRPNSNVDQQERGNDIDHCMLDAPSSVVTVTFPVISTVYSTIVRTESYTQYFPVPTDWSGWPGSDTAGTSGTKGFDSGTQPEDQSNPALNAGLPPWLKHWDGNDENEDGPQANSERPGWRWPWSRPEAPQHEAGQPEDLGQAVGSGQSKPKSSLQPPPPSWSSEKNTVTSTRAFSTSTTSSTRSSSSRSPQPTPTPDDWPDHTVTAYFGAGNTNIFPAEKIPWKYLTHLCFAFASVGGAANNYSISLGSHQALLRYLSEQAQAHGVRLILSIGGAGDGGKYFSDMVQTNQSISAFVESVKDVVSEFDLAGVDIDWEHVGKLTDAPIERPFTDANGYLQMLKALRAALPVAELSAAVSMNLFRKAKSPTDGTLENVDMTPFIPLFDRIYLMSYDLWNPPDDDTAGSNAALEYHGESPSDIPDGQDFGADGVQAWHDAGFPMSKLVYGVPFYGYGYYLTDDSDPNTTGLYSPVEDGKSSGDSDEGPDSTSGFWKWRNLKSQKVVVQQADGSYGAGPGWTYGFDDSTQTPYVFTDGNSTDEPQIISYDDPHSIGLKKKFAKSRGMEGMMFWAMYGDTDDAELTRLLA
ncbi:hypothetical protein LTR84_012790 [Exophiala bonariae]|uniref:chitinase n=1 Tax=Exophiala bonariae TaxID=1690606 RepID=A0AAV9NFD1_9EURO|nr:hypothetical protein LTR84_012790 [Exophiala bonariae]